MATLKELGKNETFNEVVLTDRFPFFNWNEAEPLLRPLLEAQPYIHSVRRGLNGEGMVDLNTWWLDDFRNGRLAPDGSWNIASLCLDRFQLPHSCLDEPWISSPMRPQAEYSPKYIVARNAQSHCHNAAMPWRRIMDCVRSETAFIGLKTEWERFNADYGPIEHLSVPDLAVAAAYIAGAKGVFCNQSVFHAIAEGLKKPVLLEVCNDFPSVIFRRPRAFYAWSGRAEWWPSLDEVLASMR
jgi:hypothetical protein